MQVSIIRKGKVKVDFYTKEKEYIESIILKAGEKKM